MRPLELGATYFSKWQRSITHGGNAHHTIFLYHLSTMHRPPSIVHFQSGYKDGLNRLWSHSISSHFAADSVFSFGFVSGVSIFFRGGGGEGGFVPPARGFSLWIQDLLTFYGTLATLTMQPVPKLIRASLLPWFVHLPPVFLSFWIPLDSCDTLILTRTKFPLNSKFLCTFVFSCFCLHHCHSSFP